MDHKIKIIYQKLWSLITSDSLCAVTYTKKLKITEDLGFGPVRTAWKNGYFSEKCAQCKTTSLVTKSFVVDTNR